tara:strand:- start:662 stop:847 length:186 start_codon:yes stop_codon:yes gene_type:complete
MSGSNLTKSQKKNIKLVGVEWESESNLFKKGVCKSSLLSLYCKGKLDKKSIGGEDHYKLKK